MSGQQNPISWFQNQFESNQAARAQQEPEWLTSVRSNAMLRFAEMGFPNKKFEEWQYTKLNHLLSQEYAPTQTSASVSEDALKATGEFVAEHRLIFIDGVFNAELSNATSLPEGVVVSSLAQALQGDASEELQSKLNQLLDSRVKNPLTLLNLALFEDGCYIHVPRNVQVETSIEAIFVSSGQTQAAYHPRNIVHLERGAEAMWIERYVSLEEGAEYWSNPATAFWIEENAHLSHVKLQTESRKASHIAQMHVFQTRDSQLSSHLYTLGGSVSRHEVETVLAGEQIACRLNGLYIAGDGQHMDNRIFMEHKQVHGFSDQYYKGILFGSGVGAFSGRILVQQDAQKTDAYQRHQALLLSDNASVYSKPQLEIYADDVKCSHGATTGNLDKNALFYLRSRGIPEEQARRMLIRAFAEETVERIGVESIQEYVLALLEDAMSQ